MLSKTTVVLLLGAVAMCAAMPQLPLEELTHLPRAEAVSRLKALLRGPLQAALRPAIDTPATRSIIDDQIIAHIENFRVVMREGSELLGTPVLDPFHLSHLEGETHQKYIDFEGSLDDFVIEGLSDFIIDNIKFNTILLTFNFGFTMPEVVVTGKYGTDTVLAHLLPIYGEGPFKVEIGDLVIVGKAKLALRNLIHIYVKSIDLSFTLGKYNSEIDGLLGGGDLSDLLNEVINDLVPEIIEANSDLMAEIIADRIVIIVNAILGEMTLQDLLDLIAGGSGSGF